MNYNLERKPSSHLSIAVSQIITKSEAGVPTVSKEAANRILFQNPPAELQICMLYVSIVNELVAKDSSPAALKRAAAQITKLVDNTDRNAADFGVIGEHLEENCGLFLEIVNYLPYQTAKTLGCVDCATCDEERAAKYIDDLFGKYKGDDLTTSQEKVWETFENRFAEYDGELNVRELARQLLVDDQLPPSMHSALEKLRDYHDSELAGSLLYIYSLDGIIVGANEDPAELNSTEDEKQLVKKVNDMLWD